MRPRVVFVALLVCLGAGAVPRAQLRANPILFDDLFAAYTAGDREVVSRILSNGFAFQNFQASLDKPSDKAPTNSAKNTTESTNSIMASAQNVHGETNDNLVARTDDAKAKPPPRGRTFTWRDVESEDYQGYLANLSVRTTAGTGARSGWT